MRVKHIWDYIPLPAKFKLFVDRITFNRITFIYFIFSAIHCFLQVVFQVQAFTINAKATNFLSTVINQGNATESGFTVLGQDLWLCEQVPTKMDTSQCKVVWSGKSNVSSTSAANIGNQNVAQVTYNSAGVSASTSTSTYLSSGTSLTPPTTSVSSSDSIRTPASNPLTSAKQASTTSSGTTTRRTVTLIVQPTNLSELQSAADELTSTTAPSTATPRVGFASGTQKDAGGEDNYKLRRAIEGNIHPHIVAALTTNGQKQVKLNGFQTRLGMDNITLDDKCLLALNWAVTKLENTKREDVVFICYSFWVLGMSIVAILNESFPHIIASLLTHVLATVWAGLSLNHTNNFHSGFNRLVVQGTCRADLLPGHWADRARGEIPVLALNCLALVVSGLLSWKLMNTFGWQTFKRIGASFALRRAYHFILVLSITIQISVFFTVAAVALWLDQIMNGDIGRLTSNPKGFEAATIFVLVLLIPWLTLGWIAVRREHKIGMGIFLTLSLLYLVGWGAMFDSPTFRWTFREWVFFALMAVASVALSFITLVIGVVCRINFGKGLPYYLKAQVPLPGDDFLRCTPGSVGDIEKVPFPSHDAPIPTFSAAFGSGPDIPPPTHMFASRVLGPRFYNTNTAPFDAQPQTHEVIFPGGRPAKIVAKSGDGRDLVRQGSDGSLKSGHTTTSSEEIGVSRRWVIE